MNKRNKKLLGLSIVVISIFTWSILLLVFDYREIIGQIGLENSYWIIFLIATIAGVSSVTSTSYYASVVAFAIAGSNPFLLAIFAGLGMSIGDSLFYLLGKKGSQVLPEKIDKYQDRIEIWIHKKPKWLKVTLIYMYTGFSPFPGDLLSIFLGIANFKYKLIIWPIILGNITLMTIISLFAQYELINILI